MSNTPLPPCCDKCHGPNGVPVVMRHLGEIAPPIRVLMCARCVSGAPGTQILVLVLADLKGMWRAEDDAAAATPARDREAQHDG